MEPVVRTEKLSKWYGNILGVSDLSLEITPGIKGLLGPNGAGKSTFLKLISGQLKPSIGTVRVFDQPVWSNPGLFELVGFCPENDSYYREMNAQEFLTAKALWHGFKDETARKKVDLALDRVGLADNRHRLIRTHSFGMRQRLRFASSIIHDPQLLILDEPLRGMDPLWRIKVVRLIKEFAGEGKTIIISSHILHEIEGMTEEVILIHQGKVIAQGNISYIRNLIDAHPHQISITCPDPRSLAKELIGEGCVLGVEFDAGVTTVTFKTSQRERFFDLLTRLIVAQKLEVEAITSPDDNLQAVFEYLIGR